ncbi:serine protease [Minicystis rosea]|nr:serine protease [Minicystis rosea]
MLPLSRTPTRAHEGPLSGVRRTLADGIVVRGLVPNDRRAEIAEMIPAVLGPLDAATIDAVVAQLVWIVLRRGERLFAEGDPADGLYLVVSGRLSVLVASPSGEPRVVKELSRGQSVGEMALVSEKPRGATVIAARDAVLAKLPREAFDALCAESPSVVRAVARVLVDRLNQGNAGATMGAPHQAVSTVAVVPVTPGAPVERFCKELARALGTHGTTSIVSSALVEEELEVSGAATDRHGDPGGVRAQAWLEEVERRSRFTLYLADDEATPWSRRAIRNADRVLLVADATASSSPGPVERALFADGEASVAGVHRELVLVHPQGTARPRGTAAFLDARPVERHHHVRAGELEDIARIARFLSGTATALVLGGGGARAAAHLGVLRALDDLSVPIDLVVGASSGAGVGAHYALGADPRAMLDFHEHLWGRMAPHRAYVPPILSLVSHHVLDAAAKHVAGDADVEDTWIPFACVSANLTRGELVVHRRGPLWRAIRATTALPGIFPPMIESGEVLVDGGVLDNLPWRLAKDLHDGPTIAVDISPPRAIQSDLSYEEIPSAFRLLLRSLNPFRKTSLGVPGCLQVIVGSATASSVAHRDQAEREVDWLLRPDVARFGMLDFSSIRKLAEVGYRCAIAASPAQLLLARGRKDSPAP